MLKQKLIAKIHILKKQASLDEDTYRLKLEMLTGKNSCKTMSIKQLEKVVESFGEVNKKPYYKPTVNKSKFEFVETSCTKMAKIFKLWQELADTGKVRDSSNKGLNSFLQSKFSCTYQEINTSSIAFNSKKDAIIEALKSWYKREIKKVIN